MDMATVYAALGSGVALFGAAGTVYFQIKRTLHTFQGTIGVDKVVMQPTLSGNGFMAVVKSPDGGVTEYHAHVAKGTSPDGILLDYVVVSGSAMGAAQGQLESLLTRISEARAAKHKR